MTFETITVQQVENNAQLLWLYPESTFYAQNLGTLSVNGYLGATTQWATNYWYGNSYQNAVIFTVISTFEKMADLMAAENPRWHFREKDIGQEHVWGHTYYDLACKIKQSKQFNNPEVLAAIDKVIRAWNDFDPLKGTKLINIEGFGRFQSVADRRRRLEKIICHWNSVHLEPRNVETSISLLNFYALRDGKKPSKWPNLRSLKEPKSYKMTTSQDRSLTDHAYDWYSWLTGAESHDDNTKSLRALAIRSSKSAYG
ncbi:MAG: hypothetical protein KDK72_07735 [Chlamydiia bacterium]|nr:hypothetical protein [Chlamydiia bacterium]